MNALKEIKINGKPMSEVYLIDEKYCGKLLEVKVDKNLVVLLNSMFF